MTFFAHRGNIKGPAPGKENSPAHVDRALDYGVSAEVDLRAIDEDFYLGHDFPRFKISFAWLETRHVRLLLHVKDFLALKLLLKYGKHMHWFCHSYDPFTITSRGRIWVHDISGCMADRNSIVPLITLENLKSYQQRGMHGVCSDFVHDWEKLFA
jgi:hypothetical protein